MEVKKKAKKPINVKKPFLRGDAVDSNTPKGAFGILGVSVMMAVLFLVMGPVLMLENVMLRIVLNLSVIAVTYMMFYYYGMSSGSVAVNQGEIMYNRKENGHEVTKAELSRCFHPAKGFVTALLGVLPLIICAVLLAVLAQKQVSTIGVLPSWMSGMVERAEISAPIKFYQEAGSFGIENVMRIIVRMALMPMVNLFNPGNADNMLLMERLSPILMLLPAVAYGVGYLGGVQARSKVHSDIARSKKRRNRKAKQQIQAKKKAPVRKPKGPEQLN